MNIFIDIDGTIADARKRFAAAGNEPPRSDKFAYSAWLEKVQSHESLAQDKVVPGMLKLVQSLSRMPGTVYLTARNEEFRNTTLSWLHAKGFPSLELLMRATDDWDGSGEYKGKTIKKILNSRSTDGQVIVIDDDPLGDIEAMCLREGYTFLKAIGYGC